MAISQSALLSANIPGSYSTTTTTIATTNDTMELQENNQSNTTNNQSTNPYQQHLIQQLLNMTEDDFNKLPIDQRQKMFQLREQILGLNTGG